MDRGIISFDYSYYEDRVLFNLPEVFRRAIAKKEELERQISTKPEVRNRFGRIPIKKGTSDRFLSLAESIFLGIGNVVDKTNFKDFSDISEEKLISYDFQLQLYEFPSVSFLLKKHSWPMLAPEEYYDERKIEFEFVYGRWMIRYISGLYPDKLLSIILST